MEHDFYFSIQLGMSSSQLTSSIIFQRGSYTTNQHHVQGKFADSSIKLWWFFFPVVLGIWTSIWGAEVRPEDPKKCADLFNGIPSGYLIGLWWKLSDFFGKCNSGWMMLCPHVVFFRQMMGIGLGESSPNGRTLQWFSQWIILKFSQIRIPDSWLIGGFKHDWIIFHFIYGMSSFPLTSRPSFFKMGTLHHQPVGIYWVLPKISSDSWTCTWTGSSLGLSCFFFCEEFQAIPGASSWKKNHKECKSL